MDVIEIIKELRNSNHNNSNFELYLNNIVFYYENRKVDKLFKLSNINLSCKSGESCVIIGDNGSGKTTILRLITNFLEPINGNLHSNVPNFVIGYSSSDGTDINPFLKVKQVFDIISEKYKHTYSEQILEMIGLNQYKRKRISELSSGQKKKLSLIRAFLMGKELILLDEPESHLDFNSMLNLSVLIKELKKYVPIIFTSHNAEFIKHCECSKFYSISHVENTENEYTLKQINNINFMF